MLRRGLIFAAIAAVVIATRLCHAGILWADDNLPLAAAIEVARGKILFRDVWFDKPPLVAWICLAWGARAGVLLRLAGGAYVLAVAAMAWQFARTAWGEREGLLAASLSAFFLTFGLPSAVMPLASDMLLVLPHLAAVYFAWRGRAFLSGAAAGVGLLCSSKAVFVLAACALWQWRSLPMLAAGFATPNALAMGWMWMNGSLGEYYRQVWQWGSIYAAHTFIESPVAEGFKRTADWAGFQAALVIGAGVALKRDRDWRMFSWIALSLAGVVLGLRFFPRYYFLLLPPMTVAAARGWCLLSVYHFVIDRPQGGRMTRATVTAVFLPALLLIPFLRFAPRYVMLALHRPWADLAIDSDSRAAAEKLRSLAGPGDTLFVWGFRPDIFVYSGLRAGTRFLESQPISGVLADRHLFSQTTLAAEFTAPNRAELIASHPIWIVDGLGLYNPALALDRQPYLADWLSRYVPVDRTNFSILYRLR
jgi:hypothetical protein